MTDDSTARSDHGADPGVTPATPLVGSPVLRSPLRRGVAKHPLMTYVVLAYILSWSWWIPMAITGATTRPGQGWPTHLPGLLGPAVAAFLVTAVVSGRAGVRELAARTFRRRIPGRWYGAVILAVMMLGLAPCVAVLRGRSVPSVGDYLSYSGIGAADGPLTALAVVGVAVAVNGFGEEIGWRGFLTHRLLRGRGRLISALIVAPVWAVWHLPLFWVVESFMDLSVAGRIGWLVGLTAGSIVLTGLYQGSGNSILLVALWHVAFNFTTATTAAGGAPAATASTLVMIAAVAIAIRDVRHHGGSTDDVEADAHEAPVPDLSGPVVGDG